MLTGGWHWCAKEKVIICTRNMSNIISITAIKFNANLYEYYYQFNNISFNN